MNGEPGRGRFDLAGALVCTAHSAQRLDTPFVPRVPPSVTVPVLSRKNSPRITQRRSGWDVGRDEVDLVDLVTPAIQGGSQCGV